MTNGFSSESASHMLTVKVLPRNEISIAMTELQPSEMIQDSSGMAELNTVMAAGLAWNTNQGGQKITVAMNTTVPGEDLSVEAAFLSEGSRASSAGRVVVNAEAREILGNIDAGTGACVLTYKTLTSRIGVQGQAVLLVYTITSL